MLSTENEGLLTRSLQIEKNMALDAIVSKLEDKRINYNVFIKNGSELRVGQMPKTSALCVLFNFYSASEEVFTNSRFEAYAIMNQLRQPTPEEIGNLWIMYTTCRILQWSETGYVINPAIHKNIVNHYPKYEMTLNSVY